MVVMTPEYLGELIDRYAGPLVLYARQWCAAPEDVVQDSFVKLVQQAETPELVVPWLYRVVRNGAISQARSARRRQKYEADAARDVPAWFEMGDDPTNLDGSTITDSLSRLPVDQREVIIAHLWGGLTFEQIAELVGTSTTTAFRRYNAGLAALRNLLGASCPI